MQVFLVSTTNSIASKSMFAKILCNNLAVMVQRTIFIKYQGGASAALGKCLQLRLADFTSRRDAECACFKG